MEIHGVEHVPLVAGGHHEPLEVVGPVVAAVLQVVQQQLLKRLAVEVLGGEHLGRVLGTFPFQPHGHGGVGGFAQVQHQVALVVHVAVAAAAPSGLTHRPQEVENVGFAMPLDFGGVEVAKHLREVAVEIGELGGGRTQAAQGGRGEVRG